MRQINPAPGFENTHREKFFLNVNQKSLIYFDFKQVLQQDLSAGQVVQLDQDIQFSTGEFVFAQHDQTLAFSGWLCKERKNYYPLRVMDLEKQAVLYRLMDDNTVPINAVKISPDGDTLAAALADKQIYLI